MKEKSNFLFLRKSILCLSLMSFSLILSANDSNRIRNSTTLKSSDIKFIDDEILSGKQQAINRTNAVFNYTDNSIYNIYLKPNYLTTLKLQAGEKILFFAGGDTERWQLEESSGGKKNQPLVFIKPNIEELEEDMKTNIIIVTDKHTYFLNLEMAMDKYNPLVEWNYPNEQKIILESQERNTTYIGTDDLTKLNYDYNWNKKSPLSPEQVFDNGEQTFLVMKKNFKEMPAIYVKGTDGQISLVTSKVNGRYITLDRTTKEVLLMLGKRSLRIYNKTR